MSEEVKKKIGVGVGVMIFRDGKVLLGRRHDNPEKAHSLLKGEGKWSMPGGSVEFGETFEEAGKREAMEECGIQINNINVLCLNQDMLEGVHFVTVGLYCDDFSGEVELIEGEAFAEWKWFDLREIPENLYFPSKKLLENYKKDKFYLEGNK